MAKPSIHDDKQGARLRAEAARVVSAVVDDGRSLTATLASRGGDARAPRVRAYAYGTLRGFHRYAAVRDGLLQRPMKDQDKTVRALVLVGIYQLQDDKTPPHAAISATVRRRDCLIGRGLPAWSMRCCGVFSARKKNGWRPLTKTNHPATPIRSG